MSNWLGAYPVSELPGNQPNPSFASFRCRLHFSESVLQAVLATRSLWFHKGHWHFPQRDKHAIYWRPMRSCFFSSRLTVQGCSTSIKKQWIYIKAFGAYYFGNFNPKKSTNTALESQREITADKLEHVNKMKYYIGQCILAAHLRQADKWVLELHILLTPINPLYKISI